jgi:hypothetical protein
MTSRLSQDRPNLLWLEDRETTAHVELDAAKRAGCEVHVRAHPVEIMAFLQEEFGDDPDPQRLDALRLVFVIDIMIAGMMDLSGLGIQHSETYGGLNGGYVFVDRVLREAACVYRFRPVWFVTERELTGDLVEDLQYLRDKSDPEGGRPHGEVEYIRKRNSAELEKFKSLLGKI